MRPISGRLRLLGSELFLSVQGRPVAGSVGVFIPAGVPQGAAPHFARRTRLPSIACHRPRGSAVAGPMPAAMSAQATRPLCNRLLLIHAPLITAIYTR